MDMFATLDFDLSQPYAIQFLRRFATVKKSDLDGLSYAGAKYLIELSVGCREKRSGSKILLIFFVMVSSWYHHGRPRQVNPQVTPSYLELRYKLCSDSYSSIE